jgi:hypothetical protein
MGKLSEIEGIGAAYSEKLSAAGIKSQEKLLEAGGTPKGRKDLAAKTDISGKLILKWVNRADLARVKGVGEGVCGPAGVCRRGHRAGTRAAARR